MTYLEVDVEDGSGDPEGLGSFDSRFNLGFEI